MTKELDKTPHDHHVNRKYKDSLFRLIFSEKEGALELYNALNGSSYEDPSMLEITTIDDAIYMGIKNDLSFLVEGKMHLLEEQSTWSENMPLRGLFYFSNLYQSYVEKNQLDIYSRKRLPLPQPIYIVFYIGTETIPEQIIMRLSDSFERKTSEPAVDVVARVFNVNYGKNRDLMDRCHRLYEYSYLIQRVRHYADQSLVLEAAMDRAIDDCIQQGILKDFLLKHRGEVCNMILTKYDAAFHIQCEKQESFREGQLQTRLEIIHSMLRKGKSHEFIMENLDLTAEELNTLLSMVKEDTLQLS